MFHPHLLFPFPVHFFTYDREFITQYCQVSALLELESLLSQQSLREAFSDAELSTAKQRHQQVQDYIQVWGGSPTVLLMCQNSGSAICTRDTPWSQWPWGVPLMWLLGSSRLVFHRFMEWFWLKQI